MSNQEIFSTISTNERYKLFFWVCHPDELIGSVTLIQGLPINVINLGKELASFIEQYKNHKYLDIDVYDFVKKLLDKNKTKVLNSSNHAVAVYNVGVLLEPALKLNPVQLFKDFSKSTILILIWENSSTNLNLLHWPTQEKKYYLDFSDILLKYLNHEI